MGDATPSQLERMTDTTTSGVQETTSGVASLSLADKKDKISPTGDADSDQTKLPGVAQIRMETAFTSLCTSHATFIQPAPYRPSIVIAFDEAHNLAKLTADRPFSRAHMLCRAINAFTKPKQSVWVVFASTNSRIADYSPPNILRTSTLLCWNILCDGGTMFQITLLEFALKDGVYVRRTLLSALILLPPLWRHSSHILKRFRRRGT